MRLVFQSRIKTIVFAVVCLSLFGAALKAYSQANGRRGRLRSFSGPNGHVMIIVPPAEFMMGSPLTERGRSQDETQHRVRIPRTYAIATTEVTNEQFARSWQESRTMALVGEPRQQYASATRRGS